jgi:hypothetical protein
MGLEGRSLTVAVPKDTRSLTVAVPKDTARPHGRGPETGSEECGTER